MNWFHWTIEDIEAWRRLMYFTRRQTNSQKSCKDSYCLLYNKWHKKTFYVIAMWQLHGNNSMLFVIRLSKAPSIYFKWQLFKIYNFCLRLKVLVKPVMLTSFNSIPQILHNLIKISTTLQLQNHHKNEVILINSY